MAKMSLRRRQTLRSSAVDNATAARGCILKRAVACLETNPEGTFIVTRWAAKSRTTNKLRQSSYPSVRCQANCSHKSYRMGPSRWKCYKTRRPPGFSRPQIVYRCGAIRRVRSQNNQRDRAENDAEDFSSGASIFYRSFVFNKLTELAAPALCNEGNFVGR
jgi:hypothetical protein